MKYKAQQRINQRITRITPQHLLIGIDIGKEKHVAAAVNFRGIEVSRKLTFANDRLGVERLLEWMETTKKRSGLTAVLVGMESTGHYYLPLANGLREAGLDIALVNPLTTKRNKENRDNRPSKSDAKDALVIAECVSRGFYNEWNLPAPRYQQLRHQVNEREAISVDATALGNQIQTLLDEVFPEFTKVFKHWNCPRGIATLKAFPLPRDLQGWTPEQMIVAWHEQGMKRAGGLRGLQTAHLLLAVASRSLGLTEASEAMRQRLHRLLARYEQLQADLTAVEAEIAQTMQALPSEVLAPLQALGLSGTLMATILANTGDLRQYEHGQQVLALAGLNLAERQSGKHKGEIRLSKRGRRQLRKYLYLAAMNLVSHHPAFKAWHIDNVTNRRMKKQRSLFKLMGKLVRILVALAHSGEAFDANRARAIQAVA